MKERNEPLIQEKTDIRRKFITKGKAEFSMGILDYERYDKNLLAIDDYSVRALQDINVVLPYFGCVRQFYRQMRSVLLFLERDDIVKEYDGKFKELKAEILSFLKAVGNVIQKSGNIKAMSDRHDKVVESIGQLNEDVLFMKQNLGLGIMLKKDVSFDTRLNRGLGLSK